MPNKSSVFLKFFATVILAAFSVVIAKADNLEVINGVAFVKDMTQQLPPDTKNLYSLKCSNTTCVALIRRNNDKNGLWYKPHAAGKFSLIAEEGDSKLGDQKLMAFAASGNPWGQSQVFVGTRNAYFTTLGTKIPEYTVAWRLKNYQTPEKIAGVGDNVSVSGGRQGRVLKLASAVSLPDTIGEFIFLELQMENNAILSGIFEVQPTAFAPILTKNSTTAIAYQDPVWFYERIFRTDNGVLYFYDSEPQVQTAVKRLEISTKLVTTIADKFRTVLDKSMGLGGSQLASGHDGKLYLIYNDTSVGFNRNGIALWNGRDWTDFYRIDRGLENVSGSQLKSIGNISSGVGFKLMGLTTRDELPPYTTWKMMPHIIAVSQEAGKWKVLVKESDIVGSKPVERLGPDYPTQGCEAEFSTIKGGINGNFDRLYQVVLPCVLSVSNSDGQIALQGKNLALPDTTTEVLANGRLQKINFSSDQELRFATTENGTVTVQVRLNHRTGIVLSNSTQINLAAVSPVFTARGIVNGASFKPEVAPCSIASLFGERLSQQGMASASALPLPNNLAGTRILVNNREAPLFFVSAGQVNFLMPCEETAGAAVVRVETRKADGTVLVSEPASVNIVKEATGVFRYGPELLPIAVNENGLISTTNPAEVGKYIIIYATGLGAVTPAVKSGEAAPTEPLARTVAATSVKVGGVEAEVLYSGLTPGFVGLYQVNARMPEGVTAGEQSLELIVGGSRDVSKIPVK